MRRAIVLLTVGLVLGAVIATTVSTPTPADAKNGDVLVLGTKNNARNSTKIISPNSTQFINTKAGRPAITLNVKPGAPPMAVNSTVRVTNLNADNVDGYTSSQLRSPYTWLTSDNIPDTVEWSSTVKSIDVPTGGGALLLTGSVDIYNSDSVVKAVSCYFLVDGTILAESYMTLSLDATRWGHCTSVGATTLPAGPHLVQFLTTGMADANVTAWNGTWWAIVAPG